MEQGEKGATRAKYVDEGVLLIKIVQVGMHVRPGVCSMFRGKFRPDNR